MPSSIDKRIVEMQFDNSNFERNIGQSIKSLDLLEHQVGYTGRALERSFSNLEYIANTVDFTNLQDSLNFLESRFSNLGIVGMTVIQNLTTTAMQQFGKISSAVVGMAKTGGINRALNIENAKFQLEGLGVAWDSIQEDINYGVKDTAYGLDEAAKAASQLVASQVQLGDEMKMSLRGISGVAAMTNSSYSDIAHIFTTVAGNGRLMTMQLQQMSYKGLNAAATLAESLHVSEATLREMVSKGEIDFKTFAKAMDDAFGSHAKDANKTFTGAMSNMRAAFSRLGAKVAAPTMENLRRMIVQFIDVVNDVSAALDPLINDFNKFFDNIRKGANHLLGNKVFSDTYNNYIEAMRLAFYDLLMIIDPIREAFREIFPAKSLEDARTFSERLKEFVSTFYITRENADKLRRTFKGLFSIIDILGQAFGAVFKEIFGARDGFFDLGSSILDVTANFGDFLTNLARVLKETNFFGDAVHSLRMKLEPFYYFFKGLVVTLSTDLKFDKFLDFIDAIKGSDEELTTFQIVCKGFKAVLDDIGKAFTAISPVASAFFGMIGRALGEFGSALTKAFSGGGWNTLFALMNGSLLTGIVYTVERIMSTINGITWQSLGIIDTIKGPFRSLRRSIDVFTEGLKYDNILKIAKAVGILALSLVALSLIDADRLESSLTVVTECIMLLVGAFKVLTASSKGTTGEGGIFSNFFESIGEAANKAANAANLATFFIGFSTGLLIMASAVKKLAALDMESLQRGLLAIVALLTATTMSINSMAKNEGEVKIAATSMIGFAVGIKILASTAKMLAEVDFDQLKYGLGSVAGLMTAVGIFINKVDTESFKLSAVSMIGFAVGINILSSAAASLSNIPFDQLVVGVGGVLGLITGVGVFINSVDSESFKLSAISMLGFAASLLILSNVAINLAALSWETLLRGLVGVAGLMLSIGAFINNIKSDTNLIQVAAGMVVLGAAMRIMAPAIQMIGAMDLWSIIKGLGAFALAITGFALGAKFVAPYIGVINGLAAAIMMLGIGIAAAAGGIALLNLSQALLDFVHVVANVANAIIKEVTSAAPGIAQAVLTTIVQVLMVLTQGIADIAMVITDFIVNLADFVVKQGPAIMKALVILVDYTCQIIAVLIPRIVDAIGNAIIVILQKLASMAGDIAIAAGELVINFVDGVNAMMPRLVQAAFDIVISFINAFADGIDQNVGPITDACIHLIDAIWNGLAAMLPSLGEKAIDIVGAIAKGIISGAGEVWKAGAELVGELLKALGVDAEFVDAGVNAVKGFIDGMVSWAKNAVNKAKEIAKNIFDAFCGVLKIESPSKVMEWAGKMIDTGLADGMNDNVSIAESAAEVLGDTVVDTVETKVDDGITGLKDKMNNFSSYLERWLRIQNSKIPATNKAGVAIDNEGKTAMQRELYERRKAAGVIDKFTQSVEAATEAEQKEEEASTSNTKATGGSSRAKQENKEVNEEKTEAIEEETEALEEEEEAVEDNSEAIRKMADEIEIITEKYHAWVGVAGKTDPFKTAVSLQKQLGKFWSKTLSAAKPTASYINKVFKPLDKNLKMVSKTVKTGVYQYDKTGKYIGVVSKKVGKSSKALESYARSSGNIVIKVTEGQATAFENLGYAVEKSTTKLTKNVKKLASFRNEARAFTNWFNGQNESSLVLGHKDINEINSTLRQIEKYYTTLGSMPQKVQDYLGAIRWKMGDDLAVSMNALGKSIDGISSGWNKSSQTLAYTTDAFMNLAAALYDGSEAANEYETEHARLIFLAENGEATWEEVEEHQRSYIQRLIDTLQEYRQTLDSTFRGGIDIFSEFNKNFLPEGTDLLKNIESQIAGFTQFGDMIMELSKRGLNFGILKQLADEGVSSYGKLYELTKMTRGELALFNQYYKESEAAIAHARDMSLSAVANATTQAAQRAAAASGKMTKAQLKQSKKAAKALISDAKAVADNQARYRVLTIKEEEHYLKNLTEEAKAAYHEQVKASKKAAKEEEKLAKQEKARRKEEAKNNAIIEKIKNYKTLNKTLLKYADNGKVVKAINQKLNETFKVMGKTMTKTTTHNLKSMKVGFLKFAETLESTGNEANDYFTEMQERIKKYIDSVKDAVKANMDFSQSIDKIEKTSGRAMVKNAKDQLSMYKNLNKNIETIMKKPFSADVLSPLLEHLEKGDVQKAAEYAASLVGLTAGEIASLNRTVSKTIKSSKSLANHTAQLAASENAVNKHAVNYLKNINTATRLEKEYKDAINLSIIDNSKAISSSEARIHAIDEEMNKVREQIHQRMEAAYSTGDSREIEQARKDKEGLDKELAKLKAEKEGVQNEIKNLRSTHGKDILQANLENIKRQQEANESEIAMLQSHTKKTKDENAALQGALAEREYLRQQETKALQAINDRNSLMSEAQQKKAQAAADKEKAIKETTVAQAKALVEEKKQLKTQLENEIKESKTLKRGLENLKASQYIAKGSIDARISTLKAKKGLSKEEAEELKSLQSESKSMGDAIKETADEITSTSESIKNATKDLKIASGDYDKAVELQKEAENREAALAKENDRVEKIYNTITSLEALKKVIANYKGDTAVMKLVNEQLDKMFTSSTDIMQVLRYGESSTFFPKLSAGINATTHDLTNLKEGMIRLGEVGVEALEDTEEWWAKVTENVNEYIASVKDAVKQSSNLFEQFEKGDWVDPSKWFYSAASQIDAKKEWSTSIMALAEAGLNPDIIKDFVDQGLGSYEKVMSLAKNMTKESIGELNYYYEQNSAIAEEAAAKAASAVFIANSDAAKAMGKAAVKAFQADTRRVQIREIFKGILNVKDLKKVIEKYKNQWDVILRIHTDMIDAFHDFQKDVDHFNATGSFLPLRKEFQKTYYEFSMMESGFMNLAEAMGAAAEEGETAFQAMNRTLNEFRNSLKETIKSSVDFFSKFSKYADEENPLTATDYLENAESQLDALTEWSKGLEELAAKGLDKEILNEFAQAGLGSYEKVMAWNKATERQIGEYNEQWRKFNKLIDDATKSAFVSVVAAYSDVGQKMQDAMVNAFKTQGPERIAKVVEDEAVASADRATVMIIDGIRHGIDENQPRIAQITRDSAGNITEVVSTSITDALKSKEAVTAMKDGVKANAEAATSIAKSEIHEAMSSSAVDSIRIWSDAAANICNTLAYEFRKTIAYLSGDLKTATDRSTYDVVWRFQDAINKINDYANKNINTQPVIRPQVDLSVFNSAVANMNAAINAVRANAASAQAEVAAAKAAQAAAKPSERPAEPSTVNINVTQNNTSPKALDQVEIKRQQDRLAEQVNHIVDSKGVAMLRNEVIKAN